MIKELRKFFLAVFRNSIIQTRINKIRRRWRKQAWAGLSTQERIKYIYHIAAEKHAIRRMMKLKY